MKRLIEIVPNFSEGRRKEVIDKITGVVENIEDALAGKAGTELKRD